MRGKKSSTKTTAPSKPSPTKSASVRKSFLDGVEEWLMRNEKPVLWSCLAVCLIFSVLLFDVKMSEGNDDSDYIEGAFKFSKDASSYYNTKAPLYPIVLSIPVKLFGIKVILLKSLSVLFNLLQVFFLFKAFRKLIPHTVLFTALFFISINSYFQYFASQTYSEAFFCMLQAIFLFSFRLVYDSDKNKIELKKWLGFGLILFILTITKNISIGAVAAVALMFLLYRQFKFLIVALCSFLIFRIPFEVLKGFIWKSSNQFSSQYQILLQKDPYDASKGVDDFSGFLGRLTDNTSIYISKRLYQIFGFISPDSTTTKAGLVLITFILLGIGLYHIIKSKNKFLVFTFLYVFCMAGLTFFVLQTRWDQPRMVLVYVPFILMIVFYGFYKWLAGTPSVRSLIYFFTAILLLGSSFISTVSKAGKNFNTVRKNLAGDSYYGYTMDWQNFVKMSKYCADSLPASSLVASRKAPISFIYSNGKEFYPVYTVFSDNADTILNAFQKDKVTHIILASLRRNPKKNDGFVINTMQRLMQPIAQKYPQKISLVKQIGESEPAYLYEFKY